MIVGRGMIAQSLKDIDENDIVFFASGVSLSSEININNFNREKELLLNTIDSNLDCRLFIYFSSCGIEFESTPYFEHKKNMENIIKSYSKNYYIFRLPQVVGNGGNKNTLFNYLINQIKELKKIEIWNGIKRNLIDIDDIVLIINKIIKNNIYINNTINIASPHNCSILEIANIVASVLNKQLKYDIVNKGKAIDVNINKLNDIIDMKSIFKDKEQYIKNLVIKYYKG